MRSLHLRQVMTPSKPCTSFLKDSAQGKSDPGGHQFDTIVLGLLSQLDGSIMDTSVITCRSRM